MVGNLSETSLGAVRQAFGCGEALAATIASFARETEHRRGALLWQSDQPGLTVLMAQGSALELAYGREGAALVLHALKSGELFGGLMSESESAAAQVEAVDEGRCARFGTDAVLRLMESYPSVSLALARQMAMRISAMRRRMTENVMLSATGRICAELLRQARAGTDLTITPMPVFAEFAIGVQSTRETVSRTISQLEKRGIVRRVDGGLAVTAPHRLEELVY